MRPDGPHPSDTRPRRHQARAAPTPKGANDAGRGRARQAATPTHPPRALRRRQPGRLSYSCFKSDTHLRQSHRADRRVKHQYEHQADSSQPLSANAASTRSAAPTSPSSCAARASAPSRSAVFSPTAASSRRCARSTSAVTDSPHERTLTETPVGPPGSGGPTGLFSSGSAQPQVRPSRASGARTAGCRRCGSSRPRRGCRCAAPRRTRPWSRRPSWRSRRASWTCGPR